MPPCQSSDRSSAGALSNFFKDTLWSPREGKNESDFAGGGVQAIVSLVFSTVLFTLAYLPGTQFSSIQTPPEPKPPGQLIDVGGYRIHLHCTGKGTPPVMIVGGGFSFDWGLVQPEIAKFTRVCTYDPAGTAWSDPPPDQQRLSCANRVSELHRLLESAEVKRPVVLVGYSIGAPLARFYASKYPADISGLVLIDHAFEPQTPPTPPASSLSARASGDSPPILLSAPSIDLDVADDQNFARLPQLNRELHRWALSHNPDRPGSEDIAECMAGAEARDNALRTLPLVVVSTLNDSPGYLQLQTHLLALSDKSEQIIAKHSSHMVIIDAPEVIVAAVHTVFENARSRPQ